jgi:hypothetical protein
MPRTLQFTEDLSILLLLSYVCPLSRQEYFFGLRISVCVVQERGKYENIKQKRILAHCTQQRAALRVAVNRIKGNIEQRSCG